MTKKISRAQWEQITKRVRMAEYKLDQKWKCLLCGFKFRTCDHTVAENEELIALVKQREQVA